MSDENKSKLHIDSDWKAEAQAEKERLVAKDEARGVSGAAGASGQHGLPEANFQTLMSVLASQAIMGLGGYTDPKSGRMMIDLEGARFSIDLLAVLEEKSKGNLSNEEETELQQVLSELRNRYVQIADMVKKQQASAASAGTDASAGGGKGPVEL